MRPQLLGLILAISASWAYADQITLKYDDGTGVTGELLEFTDGILRIQASVGLIGILASDVSCIGVACPAGIKLEVASAPVTLTSVDGSLQVSGDVVDFVDGDYILATNVGEMQISADQVTCEGAGCIITAEPATRDVVLVNGDTTIEGELLGFEDGAYILNSLQLGEIRIDAATFECRGETCP